VTPSLPSSPGGTKVYIIYRDTYGVMAKTPLGAAVTIGPNGLVAKGTGHTGFLIVHPDGSSYVVDTIPDPDGSGSQKGGVRKTDLDGFNDGQAQNLWFFDAELTQEQINALNTWLTTRDNPNTPELEGVFGTPYGLFEKGSDNMIALI
jgi:hypothetical protein